MKKSNTVRAFTLAELLVSMILFGIVMAASAAAIAFTMNLMNRETDQMLSTTSLRNTASFVSDQIRYGSNIYLTKSLHDPSDPERYSIFLDGEDSKDTIIHIKGGKVYAVEGFNSLTGAVTSEYIAFDNGSGRLDVECVPVAGNAEISEDTAVTNIEKIKIIVRSSDSQYSEEDKKGKNIRKLTATRMNSHKGNFCIISSDISDSFTDDYFICIDYDYDPDAVSDDAPDDMGF